ncbi:four-carbon acid sugar kinase family protein [Streptomyces longispororuber]|uniref:four-carbon acid sugar kinase family protein n=1 Tax=Streptomyces longispororuber TaxID=68230 RepID=UPI0021087B41|nr:four-carbon acid sugar kinase family protein [Streptomyces longispororuber]MCQ4206205.1 hypothetical protein [Streptomyces longispororuber]
MRVSILADDLTSAGDGAAPFGPARVLLAAPAAPQPDGVLAVDLDTRTGGPERAAARTADAARLLGGSGLLLKTVDSTLRGHLAAEIRAAWQGSGRRTAVVAPAFPAQRRTTVRGVQYVADVPVHRSEFGRDPVHPVRCADLREILPEALLATPDGTLPRLLGAGGLFIGDAATDADLARLVAAVPDPADVLWVGSPGLAGALARRFAPAGPSAALPQPPARAPLVVVGSANPASRRQLATLLRHVPGARLLHTPDDRRDPLALLKDLAERAGAQLADGTVDALVVTGGETAAAVLTAAGADGFDLLDEPEPGVAQGLLTGPPGLPRVPVVIKAGGFGDDETLLRLYRRLGGAA